MGTIYELVSVEKKRIFNLDKLHFDSTFHALIEVGDYDSKGMCVITLDKMRLAVDIIKNTRPSEDESEDDIAYSAWKIQRAVLWMEKIGANSVYFVNDGDSDWPDRLFALTRAEEDAMGDKAVRDWLNQHYQYTTDDAYSQSLGGVVWAR